MLSCCCARMIATNCDHCDRDCACGRGDGDGSIGSDAIPFYAFIASLSPIVDATPAIPYVGIGLDSSCSCAVTAARRRRSTKPVPLVLERCGPDPSQLEEGSGRFAPWCLRQHMPIRMRVLPASCAGVGKFVPASFLCSFAMRRVACNSRHYCLSYLYEQYPPTGEAGECGQGHGEDCVLGHGTGRWSTTTPW